MSRRSPLAVLAVMALVGSLLAVSAVPVAAKDGEADGPWRFTRPAWGPLSIPPSSMTYRRATSRRMPSTAWCTTGSCRAPRTTSTLRSWESPASRWRCS